VVKAHFPLIIKLASDQNLPSLHTVQNMKGKLSGGRCISQGTKLRCEAGNCVSQAGDFAVGHLPCRGFLVCFLATKKDPITSLSVLMEQEAASECTAGLTSKARLISAVSLKG